MGMQSSGSLHPCPYGLYYKVHQHEPTKRAHGLRVLTAHWKAMLRKHKRLQKQRKKRSKFAILLNCEFQLVIRVETFTKVLDILTISPQNIVWWYIVMQLSCNFQNIVKISISHFFWKYHTIFIMRDALWIAFNLPLKLRSLDSLHL